ncbi:MAG TPA: hypothetical protein VHE32_03615 [Rhodanobacteraceae bacterium]|nr:hypothetical protein [Rhodanobacteraceae bacterium]
MDSRSLGLGIVLVLGAQASVVRAGEGDDSALAQYQQTQLSLYDALVADSSPRTQVLAGRLYFDDTDLRLRPKVADVVARAGNFAPDDAFVQWMAADVGRYSTSQCGPVKYPEREVAALVRLEPDNAAALSYAAALAQAKNDADATDEALARMAAAKRADDHAGEEIATWRAVYLAHPPSDDQGLEASLEGRDAPEQAALQHALMKTSFRSAPTSDALASACKPDANSARTWQRIGWCVDAGLLLAQKGNSFALRDEGVAMLDAAGATSEDLADLRRGLAWLKANAASYVNTNAFSDTPEERDADWEGAPSEIEATRRRLARLGLPATPPASWAAPSERGADTAEGKASTAAWQDYVTGLVDEMRGSSDAREQALALTSAAEMPWLDTASAGDAAKNEAAGNRAKLVGLAASHRGDVLVNWLAAASASTGEKSDSATLANLQRIDGDNAATWALSFGAPDADADATLQRMAASRRYDEHYIDLLGVWDQAIARHGVPEDMADTIGSLMPTSAKTLSPDDARATMSVMFAVTGAFSAIRYNALDAACANAETARRASCAAVGRLMFDSGRSLLTVRIGEMMLRKADALDDADRKRARQLAWWTQNTMEAFADGASPGRYLEDTLASKNELDAIRAAMARSGKLGPPAGWESPAEQAERKKREQ